MITDSLHTSGTISLVLTGPNGEVKSSQTVPNLIVTSGKNFSALRMSGTTAGVMSHMAVGTSSSAPIPANTTLGTEIGRVALVTAGGVVSDNIISHSGVFGPGVGTGPITEAGIFNASSGGIMLNRAIFSVVNKDALDSLTINWAVTIS